MKSVERRAGTVEEATEAALLELGLGITDAHVEIIGPRRRGLFGQGREVVVRLTAKLAEEPPGEPQAAAPDEATNVQDDEVPGVEGTEEDDEMTETFADDRESEDATVDDGERDEELNFEQLSPERRMELLDEESELAADFIEGLLDLLEVPGDIEIEVTESAAVVNISDVGSGLLIGRRGATLDALQELVRSSTQRQTERRSHVRVDVEGYRARQLDKLRTKCRDAIAEVRETGQPVRLEPMDAYERKMMHDVVAKTGGVTSASEGTEPKRRVVVLPAE